MNVTFLIIASLALSAENAAAENPIFKELVEKGVKTSGGRVKLPKPIMPNGLDAAGQQAALERASTSRYTAERLVQKSYYAPVITLVRTVKRPEGEGPAVRAVDFWFVAHGDWDVLTSEKFLDSFAGGGEEAAGGVVSKSGALTDEEAAQRELSRTTTEDYEERFIYTTFSLFERVRISATRLVGLSRGKDSRLAASRIDRRFDDDPEYPNRWRALTRDARAEIKPGPLHPFSHAGGYAKITRLKNPAGAVFVECHLVYEEDHGWFDGLNLVARKAPLMVREKVRTFRRKLAVAGEKAEQNSDPRN